MAKQNKIDPVIGREVEIRRVMEILSRRTIEEKLVDKIAMRIIKGIIKPGDTISPEVKDGKIIT